MTSEPTTTDFGARIADVEFIWARNSKEFLFSNSILIHGDAPVIVDPSASFTYIEQLAKARYVSTVFNTHYHGDHRSLNQLFKGVVFAAHELDAPAIASFSEYARVSDKDPESFYSHWTKDIFHKYKIVECPIAQKLKEGEKISTGSEDVNILHLPGHTPGHCGLYFSNADLLYVSDIDLTPYGPWYANVVSDIAAFKKSVERVKNFSARWYVPSHGERIYDREQFLEKLARYTNHFEDRENKILELLKAESQDMGRLCSNGIVYRRAALVDPLKSYFQFQMVEKHIEAFIEQGRIAQDGEMLVFVK